MGFLGQLCVNQGEHEMSIPTDAIIAYENDKLNDEETLDLFQKLVDSGLAWQLQGSYGRMAQRFLDAGLIHHKDSLSIAKEILAPHKVTP